MRATAWWAAALLWTGLAAVVAHAWEVVSPVYRFTGPADSCRAGDIVQVQILRLDPMPRHIPYNAYVPWGPFQDFETNYEQVIVPWPRTPGCDNYLDGIQYPDSGFAAPRMPSLPRNHYPMPGQSYPPHYRYPGHGYGSRQHPGQGSMIRVPLPNYDLESMGTVRLPTPSFTREPCFPVLPTVPDHVRVPTVRMPMGDVPTPWYMEYADDAGARMPVLDGVRMPTFGGGCGPREAPGPSCAVRLPQLSVLGDTFCRMPSFQAPNPGYRMRFLPRPVISIENALGINVGSSPRGWDPSSEWYFPDTCVPQSVLGRVTAPVFNWAP
jgi:hypothetical protein